jgi:small subunit ribosomal protein S1
MSKPTRTLRRRKADEQTQETASAEVSAEEVAVEAAPASVAPPSKPTAPRTSLADLHSELQAIADMDMSEMDAFMAGNSPTKRFSPGDIAKGHITALSHQYAFIELGLKADATIALEELDEPQVGDLVEAYVLHANPTGVQLSKRLSGEAATSAIETAVEEDLPVEGKVVSRNAGGFQVLIGSVRAFCPTSQMSKYHVDDTEHFIGQTLKFLVIEGGDNVVVSRRALEEELAATMSASFWLEVKVGNTYQGTVRAVKDFGVFVDISGAEGLVPNRELSWGGGAIDLQIGQSLEVRVIGCDPEARRLTLSAKDPGLSPWNQVGTKFTTGGNYTGTVVKVTDFGAFIELAPGLQGLLHLSRMGATPPQAGDVLEVQVMQVDHERQRLGLGIATHHDDSEIGTEVTGIIRDVMRGGIVVALEDGRSAWLSADDANLPASTTLAQRYRRGRVISAKIKQFDARRNRVMLSQKSNLDDDSWRAELGSQKAEGFGTFADLLKGLKTD